MRALVTGGTGFVGKPFVGRLLRDGWHVVMLTRDHRNTSDFPRANLTVFEIDLSDSQAICQIADRLSKNRADLDAVFHLGASLDYFNRPAVLKTNVAGTRNILNLALTVGPKKFIYCSSIEACGPVKKEQVPADLGERGKPISPYGKSKLSAEQMVMRVAENQFPAMSLRVGNVYGPHHFTFVHEIAQAILTQNRLLEFLPVYADRYIHPIHNDDVTEGLLAAYWKGTSSSSIPLVGQYATVGDLFQICAEILGKKIPFRQMKLGDWLYVRLWTEYRRYLGTCDFITYLMAPRGKRIHRAYSTTRTIQTLGFLPRVNLRSGIEGSLKWARDARILSF